MITKPPEKFKKKFQVALPTELRRISGGFPIDFPGTFSIIEIELEKSKKKDKKMDLSNQNEKNESETPKISKRAEQLLNKERTAEEEKELEELLFGKSQMKYDDQFKFHKFESINQTRNYPYKEWLGETVNDETVVVRYYNGELWIGAGRSEVKARNNMLKAGVTKDKRGVVNINNLTLERMNQDLRLEWILPSGYIEE